MAKPPPPPRPKPSAPPPAPARTPSPEESIPLSAYSEFRQARETQRPPPMSSKPLDEVDRAIAVLDDRHPDTRRLERETAASLAKKKAADEARARDAQAAERRRWAVRGGVGLGIAVAAAGAAREVLRRTERAESVEAALAPAMAPLLSRERGFVRVGASRFAAEVVQVDAAEPACFVAMASRAPGDGALRVERPGGVLEGEDSVAWCACAAESATVRLRTPGAGGVAVLRAAIAEAGGPYGLLFLEPHPRVVAPPGACAEGALDAWLGAWLEKGAVSVAKDAVLDEDLRGTLARTGFAAAGSAGPALPFAVVPGAADSCALAWSTAPRDLLSVRVRGGERPLADVAGPVGFCQSRAEGVTVWRKGAGDVVVERVAASRVGGTHGLRELAPRLGLAAVATWISDDDLAWDATATLRASGILPAEITAAVDGHPVKDARIVALSVSGATVLADPAHPTAYACEPPLASPALKSAVCVQSSALPWRTVGTLGKAGIAEAPLPFWMEGLGGAGDGAGAAGALGAELAVLKLGRRLVADGFETTTRDGVTDVEGGALVTGRGGSDGLVAVQLSREAPWVSPCTNLDPWTVGGDPAVVSLAPGAQVKLVCSPRAARDHRTVVFRHVPLKSPAK